MGSIDRIVVLLGHRHRMLFVWEEDVVLEAFQGFLMMRSICEWYIDDISGVGDLISNEFRRCGGDPLGGGGIPPPIKSISDAHHYASSSLDLFTF